MKLDTKKVVAWGLFTLLGVLALQVNVFKLEGSRAYFTLFDFFAPIIGGFIGSVAGIISVLVMQVVNLLVHGTANADLGTVIRLVPALFGVFYFSRKSVFNLVVPVVAIAAFVAHPIGRSVWYFSLFWTIPLAMHFLRDKFLLARTLGTTFTAHAVGGAMWIWAFALPKTMWVALIPVVAKERALFAVGMAVSYVVLNNVLYLITEKVGAFRFLVNTNYLWKKLQKPQEHAA